MAKNVNGGMKHQEEQERKERKISKADYSKIETISYCVVQPIS
jgi:hypothetical protein